jgi:hypothetical protein
MERRIAICVSINIGCLVETTWTSHEENQIKGLVLE